MGFIYVVTGIIALVVVYGGLAYNKFVKNKNLMQEGFSGIDVQLKRRADLVPALVETVKGYSKHEQSTLEEVTRLRTLSCKATDIEKKGQIEGGISKAIRGIFALAESYPDLKANNSFLKLQEQLSSIEDDLQYARRYYNGTVRDLNIIVESFPSNLVAGAFNIDGGKFFEIEYVTERKVPDVKF